MKYPGQLLRFLVKKFPQYTWKTYRPKQYDMTDEELYSSEYYNGDDDYFITCNSAEFLRSEQFLRFWVDIIWPQYFVDGSIGMIHEKELIISNMRVVEEFKTKIKMKKTNDQH